jgi:hypothetical protein
MGHGWPVYYLAIILALMNYKAFPMRINFNNETLERPMMFATIAKWTPSRGEFFDDT